MAHCTWTYLGDNGRQHNVGLFHGKRNGHVMIYVNRKVMVVDFNVSESKTYSFFLEEEFCEIKLDRKGDKMYYNFEINKDIDTPRNRTRKATNNKHLRQTALFFAGLVAAAILISLGIRSFKNNQDQSYYNTPVSMSTTQVLIKELTDSPTGTTVTYSFRAAGQTNDYSVELSNFTNQLILPLEEGDQFEVDYQAGFPYRHEIHFDQPSEDQIRRYYSRVIDKHLKLNPNSYPELAQCELETVYALNGLEGLANYFHQDVAVAENPRFNENGYLRTIRTPEFKKSIQENCF